MFRTLVLIALMSVANPALSQQVTSASGAILRALDKINGKTVDFEISTGRAARFGSLQVALRDCRYPRGNISGNAYAALEIVETGRQGTVFSGWMIASSPALNALEHSRYDIWVLRCKTS